MNSMLASIAAFDNTFQNLVLADSGDPDPPCDILNPKHFKDLGEGPPIVFSHGFMMDQTMFEPQIAALKDNYRVVAFDSRARNDSCTRPYDLYDLVEDCRLLLDGLDIKRCVLVGMSMGGWMALRFALKYPDRLAGLVLIDSSAGADSESKQEVFDEKFHPLQNCKFLPKSFVDWVTPLMFGESTKMQNPDLVEHWRRKFFSYSCSAVYREANSFRYRKDLSDKISNIQCPTLILHGEEDLAEPLSGIRWMAGAIPNADLAVIPRAGHSANLEQPDLVNAQIKRFLESNVEF